MKSKTGGTLGVATDNHIKWENGPDTAEAWNYVDAPWQGCIDTYTPYATIEPNTGYKAITELNVPTQGGTLIIKGNYRDVGRWQLPATDTGVGTEPATKYATENC